MNVMVVGLVFSISTGMGGKLGGGAVGGSAMPRSASPQSLAGRSHAGGGGGVYGRGRKMVGVRAAFDDGKQQPVVMGAKQRLSRMMAKYDFVSAGMGALLVTGYCAMRGQDVGTALWITVASTVTAVVVDEVLLTPDSDDSPRR